MNKIYQAFDSIKLDEKVKTNTYQRLKDKPQKRRYANLIYGISFAMAAFILFISISTSNVPQANKNDDANILTVSESFNDEILYKGQKYILSTYMAIDTATTNNKIGVVKQIDSSSDLKNDFESYYHDGYEVYKGNNDSVLIIKFNDEVLTYVKE
jgi:hypothetical protein